MTVSSCYIPVDLKKQLDVPLINHLEKSDNFFLKKINLKSKNQCLPQELSLLMDF